MDFETLLTPELRKKNWFITGGAGFIGSHVVDLLISAGARVTVYDNLSLSDGKNIAEHLQSKRLSDRKSVV